MKKILIIVSILCLLASWPRSTSAGVKNLSKRHAGRILIQTESYGRAWYVNPQDGTRYYLRGGDEGFRVLTSLGIGVSNKDLAKIPKNPQERGDAKLVNRLKGSILLQVESHGEAWYVNPFDGRRYSIRDGKDALAIMQRFGVPIKDAVLRNVPMNAKQVVADYAFKGSAYAVFDGIQFTHPYRADSILPLASLTKLMTALVLQDVVDDWNTLVTITPEIVDYPKKIVGDDTTSEVEFTAGDIVTRADLLIAMLVSSSNQATMALTRSTGITDNKFVSRMNEKAIAMGLLKTSFADPTGLDAHNVGTAKELAEIAFTVFQMPIIGNICGIHEASISVTHLDGSSTQLAIKNRNYSLMQMGFDAAKTGYLVEAKLNVVVKRDGTIAVVLHAENSRERNAILERIIK